MPVCIARPLSYLNFAQTQLLSLGDQNGILSDVKGQSTGGKEEIPALKRDVNAANLSTAKQIRGPNLWGWKTTWQWVKGRRNLTFKARSKLLSNLITEDLRDCAPAYISLFTPHTLLRPLKTPEIREALRLCTEFIHHEIESSSDEASLNGRASKCTLNADLARNYSTYESKANILFH